MSGHSKWSTIKRQKGAADIKRGQVFTKLSRAISVAVRESGGIADPESNFKLRLAIEKARTANMPKDNIQRAIDRGAGKDKSGVEIETLILEGYGPEQTAFVIECLTDNKLRTQQLVRSFFERHNGSLGKSGSVAYLFEQKGLIVVAKTGDDYDKMMEIAIDCGADDLKEEEDAFEVYSKYNDLRQVKECLAGKDLKIKEAEIVFAPKTVVRLVDNDKIDKVIKFTEGLEELDDVQRVFGNFDIQARNDAKPYAK